MIQIFDRVPDRTTPEGDIIVSPAMGKIIEIKDIDESHLSFFKEGVANDLEIEKVTLPAHVIIIEMNLSDVHVQRSPIAGTVHYQNYFPGKYESAIGRDKFDLVNLNEKMLTVIGNDRETVGVIQVAGKVARRIETYVGPNDEMKAGDVYGRIRLGSQVVLVIPRTRKLQINVGDKVIDGETVIAK